MTDTERLNKMIKLSGYKLAYIANYLGLSTYGFSRKRNNLSEFTPTEIDKLCELLNITSLEDRFAIFFAKVVDARSTI